MPGNSYDNHHQPQGDFSLFDFPDIVDEDINYDMSQDAFANYKATYDNADDQNDFARCFFSSNQSLFP